MKRTLTTAAPTAPFTGQGPFLALDCEVLLAQLNARACRVRHRLTDHPLLTMPRLLQLAQWLPKEHVRINSGAVALETTPDQIPHVDLSVEESFRTLEHSDTRIMLKGIEHHPEYGDLLNACIAEIEALGHSAMRGIHSKVGYVFISAPNMVTPYHMDPEINFLLQIRGKKTFHVLPGEDRSILSEQDIERFYSGNFDSLPFREEMKAKAVSFEMGPGDGVHIPVNHPHWVTTDNDVTVSFALTVETKGTQRRGRVFAINRLLRRMGLRPAPFGQSAWRDGLKNQGYRSWRALKAIVPHRHRKESGHY